MLRTNSRFVLKNYRSLNHAAYVILEASVYHYSLINLRPLKSLLY